MSGISVIIPCFNSEKWVGEAIESALTQDCGAVEVVVVDDGSTDASRSVIEGFGARVVCVPQPNRGVSAARNAGLRRATGDLIQFLDADDVLHRSRLSLMLRAWETKPDADFVSASYRSFRMDELSGAEFANAPPGNAVPEIRNDALTVNYLPAMSLFRKTLCDAIGPWEETLTRWVDLEYHARIAVRAGAFVYLDAPLYGYRQHDGPRISSQNRAQTNLDAALRSLSMAEAHLVSGAKLNGTHKSYFFPVYVHLARGYAMAGERERFLEMLHRAVAASDRPGFRRKALAAEAFARLFGTRVASNVLERVLPSAS